MDLLWIIVSILVPVLSMVGIVVGVTRRTRRRAEELRRHAKTGRGVTQYTDRHRYLEAAIRLVWELFDSDDPGRSQNKPNDSGQLVRLMRFANRVPIV